MSCALAHEVAERSQTCAGLATSKRLAAVAVERLCSGTAWRTFASWPALAGVRSAGGCTLGRALFTSGMAL